MDTAAGQRAVVDKYTKARLSAGINLGGTLEQLQQFSRKGRSAKGPVWVSKVDIPKPPEQDAHQTLWDVVQQTAWPGQKLWEPGYAPSIHGEWTGHRAGVQKDTPEPKLSEAEKYQALSREAKNATTVLYFQGGGFVMGGAISARPTVAKMCQRIGARAFAIDYRLSPQATLPAPHLDALLAYFYLIAPPAGAHHDPIPPSSIVLAGESAGAALALALIQILLHLRRAGRSSVRVWGRDVPIALPAGFAGLSVPGDFIQSLPSFTRGSNDWLSDSSPWMHPDFPRERIWPAAVPRGCIFCEASAVTHPLFSVTGARDWRGAPPMWIAIGSGESTADGARVLAQSAAAQGVTVQVEEYEYMTHAWAVLLAKLPQSALAVAHWADACRRLVDGEARESTATHFSLGDMKQRPLDVHKLVDLTYEQAVALMKAKCDSARDRVWTGDKKTAKL